MLWRFLLRPRQLSFVHKVLSMAKRTRWIWGIAASALTLAGCQVTKTSNPLSPSIGGPISGVVISQPNLLEPGQDWQIRMRDQPVKLMFQNADTSGPRALFYTVEIASDASFNAVIFRRTGVQAGNVTTLLQLPDPLPAGHTYWWRVRAEDGANIGEYSKVVSFVAVSPVDLGAPTALAPTGELQDLSPEFRIRAGGKSGPFERISYMVQVGNDQAFASIAATFIVDEAGAETTIPGNYNFLENRTYYWRVQSRDDGESRSVSPWSVTKTFNIKLPAPTLPPPTTQPPPSGGGGGGGTGGGGDPSRCGPPYETEPTEITQCHRRRYPDDFSEAQAVAFLRAVARDLTRAGVGGRRYGLLEKDSGANCLGYSCDIICSGNGSSQRQWDVLIDSRVGTWRQVDPDTQRVRPCEHQ
jgi:hypothetical protein